MHLFYLTFGNHISHHLQASFSILSFLAQAAPGDTVDMLTDCPEFYAHLSGRVNTLPVDEALLREWKGPHDFFWRAKIKAIEQTCNRYAGEPVIYLDSDTFLYNAANAFRQQLANNKALMHLAEGPLSQAGSKTEKKMWQQVSGRSFGGLTMQPADMMWNAGVVATPNTLRGEECRLALAICDEMCAAGVTRRLIEQYALSLVLDKTYGLTEAAPYIAHYWSNKEEWTKGISDFFTTAYFKQYTPAQTIEAFKQFPYNSIPVVKKTRNTTTRLQRLAAKLFPPRDVQYLQKA